MTHSLENVFDSLIPRDESLIRTWSFDPRFVAALAAAGVLFAAIVFVMPRASEAYETYQASQAEAAAAHAALTPAELPREWKWERKAVTFDQMFRQKR